MTASFPRAELTTLAYSYTSSNKDQLATDIRVATTNKERTERIMQRLTTPPLPKFGRVEDMAAAKRMIQLMADPVDTIKRINRYVEVRSLKGSIASAIWWHTGVGPTQLFLRPAFVPQPP